MIWTVDTAGRATAVLRQLIDPAAHLGGDHDLRSSVCASAREEAADQLLGAAVPVDVRGVDERDPGIDCGVENGEGFLRLDVSLVRAELPGAQANHADLPFGTTDGA